MSTFAGNVLKLVTGSVIAQGICVLVAPIVARLFTPEAFGVLFCMKGNGEMGEMGNVGNGVKSALDSCGIKGYKLSYGTSTQNRVSRRLVPCDEPGKKG